MSDLRDAIRDAADRHRPPEDWLERVHERARTKRRNQRVLASVVGLGLSLALGITLVVELRGPDQEESGPFTPGTACPAGTKVVPTGWWRGDGSAADAVANRDAVLHGDATFGVGIVGDAFSLDGDGDFVEVPDAPGVGSEDFTVSLWVRFTSTEGEQVLVEDWIETFDTRGKKGWTLTKLKNDRIGFGLWAAGGVGTARLDLPIDTWIHVAARRRDGRVSIFVDVERAGFGRMVRARRPVVSDASL
jgi:hypothetical protein